MGNHRSSAYLLVPCIEPRPVNICPPPSSWHSSTKAWGFLHGILGCRSALSLACSFKNFFFLFISQFEACLSLFTLWKCLIWKLMAEPNSLHKLFWLFLFSCWPFFSLLLSTAGTVCKSDEIITKPYYNCIMVFDITSRRWKHDLLLNEERLFIQYQAVFKNELQIVFSVDVSRSFFPK